MWKRNQAGLGSGHWRALAGMAGMTGIAASSRDRHLHQPMLEIEKEVRKRRGSGEEEGGEAGIREGRKEQEGSTDGSGS